LGYVADVDRGDKEKTGPSKNYWGSYRSRTKRFSLRKRKIVLLGGCLCQKEKERQGKNEYCKPKAKKPWISGCE